VICLGDKMKKKKIIGISLILVLAILFFSFSFTGFFTLKDSDKYYTIGAILPLTGRLSHLGVPEMRGIDVGINEINTKGGINGNKLKIIFQDPVDDLKNVSNISNNLIFSQEVDILISSTTPFSEVIAPIAIDNNVLFFYFSTNPNIAKTSNLIFKDYIENYESCKALAKKANNLDINSIGILTSQRSSGEQCFQGFKDEFLKDNKDKLIFHETYPIGNTDFKTSILKFKSNSVDAIFINDYANQVPGILSQINLIYMPNYLFIILPLDSVANTKETHYVFNQTETYGYYPLLDLKNLSDDANNFINKYLERYNEYPNYDAIYAYDMIKYIGKALEKCDVDNKCIYQFLINNEFDTLMGEIKFDKNGNNIRIPDIIKFENGEWIKVKD
jgi:branched-chain amino acid transport system substrate-binding protein